MKFKKYLISESKMSMSPYLSSIIKKNDKLTPEDAKKIIDAFNKEPLQTAKLSLSIDHTTGKPYVSFTTKDRKYPDDEKDSFVKSTKKILKPLGYNVTDNKVVSQQLNVYFK
jgi:predicted RND superfamily exporter protein